MRPGLERITQRFEAHFENELRDAGLNSKESRVIGLLLTSDVLVAEQIANFTLVSGSSLNETLESLTTKKLVVENQAHYSLTPSGRTLALNLSEILRSSEARTLGPIPPSEAEALQRMLERLSASLHLPQTNCFVSNEYSLARQIAVHPAG